MDQLRRHVEHMQSEFYAQSYRFIYPNSAKRNYDRAVARWQAGDKRSTRFVQQFAQSDLYRRADRYAH